MAPRKRKRLKKKNDNGPDVSSVECCYKLVQEEDIQKKKKDGGIAVLSLVTIADNVSRKCKDVELVERDNMAMLSLEILCNIMKYLHLRDMLKLDHLSRKLNQAVTMHLRVTKTMDFTEGELISWMSDRMSDSSLVHLFKRCHDLEYIYGFHPPYLSKRRQRGTKKLSIPGIIEALSLLINLKGVEVSDTLVLETLFSYFPQVEILGTFRNRDGCFPVDDLNILHIPENPHITSMNLIGIVIPKLPAMLHLKHIQLRYVHFINPQPFKDFAVPSLKSFVMANCAGPSNVLKYVPLIAGLAAARSLQRMELIRVPFLGGLLHHVVEESLRVQRFKNMQCMKFGACKHVIGMDVGFLAIASAANLEELFLQPSLTKDSLFIALKMASVIFPVFDKLSLGYTEPFQESGNWTNQDLVIEGLANITESPATITDVGMKAVGECFMSVKFLEIYNSPHIHKPSAWLSSGVNAWGCLRELVLRRCHSIKLQEFCDFIPSLPVLEAIHLELMFREPPKGCSRVGLSAGTGFGLSPMSSSLIPEAPVPPNNPVANQNEVNNNGIANLNPVDNIGDIAANPNVDDNADNIAVNNDQGNDNNSPNQNIDDDNVNDIANQNHALNGIATNEINNLEDNSDDKYSGISSENKNDGYINFTDYTNGEKPNDSYDTDVSTNDMVNTNICCTDDSQPSTSGIKQNGHGNSQNDSSHSEHATNSTMPLFTGGHHGHHCCSVDSDNSANSSRTRSHSASKSQNKRRSASEKSCSKSSSVSFNECGVNDLKNSDIKSGDSLLKLTDDSSDVNRHESAAESNFTKNEIDKTSCDCDKDGSCSNCSNTSESIESENLVSNKINSCENTELKGVPEKSHKSDFSHPNSSRGVSEQVHSVSNLQSKIEIGENNVYSTTGVHQGVSSWQNLSSLSKDCVSGDSTSYLNNSHVVESSSVSKEVAAEYSSAASQEVATGSSSSASQEVAAGSSASSSKEVAAGSSSSASKEVATGSSTSDSQGVAAGSMSAIKTRSGKSLYGKKKGLARKGQGQKISQDMTLHEEKSSSSKLTVKDPEVIEILETLKENKNEENKNEENRAKDKLTKNGKEDLEFVGIVDIPDFDRSVTKPSSENESSDEPYTCPVTRSKAREKLDQGKRSEKERRKNRKRKSTTSPENTSKSQKTRNQKLASILELTVMTDKWCQVNRRCNSPESTDSHNSCGSSGYIKIIQKRKKQPVMCNKSTSTSDPVMEDDHIQILRLRSQSLKCITMNMVGITDLVVEDCPKLDKISGQACRVLKNVNVGNATKLSRVNFTQCKKLEENNMVKEIGELRSQRNRVIFLRPMNHYDGVSMERNLFSGKFVDYNICVIYDHSPEPLETLYNRVRVQSWQDLFTGMNSELFKHYGYKERVYEESDGYPWNRSIYSMKGYSNNSTRWELITDMPWLRPLCESPDLETQNIKNPDDKRAGVYCPWAKGHDTIDKCIKDCLPNIFDGLAAEIPLCLYSIIVYVNLCDIQGTPSFDPYV